MKNWLNYNWLKLLAIVLVVGAIQKFYSFPYVYYQLMNWIVVGAALMTVRQAYVNKKTFIVWLFTFVAIFFNPIAPLYLTDSAWQIADIIVAILFFILFFIVRPKSIKTK
jgi:hypothetical protein